MLIIETSIFTRQVTALLTDEEYRAVQSRLVADPTLGSKEPGTGGLRKLRVPALGHGKRGGARIIYFWAASRDQIVMLYLFAKGERAQLTAAQKRVLKKIIEEEYS